MNFLIYLIFLIDKNTFFLTTKFKFD